MLKHKHVCQLPALFGTYIGDSEFFTVIYIRNCCFSLGYKVVVGDIIGQQTLIYRKQRKEYNYSRVLYRHSW